MAFVQTSFMHQFFDVNTRRAAGLLTKLPQQLWVALKSPSDLSQNNKRKGAGWLAGQAFVLSYFPFSFGLRSGGH
jgi:hypothetical protein